MSHSRAPKISVITVCLDSKNIYETCESIANQTSDDYEWIVIDGGSQEETLSVLSQYRDKMSFFVSEKDEGIYHAMNKGLSRVRGEYVIFMNGGDSFVYPYMLDNANFMLSHNPAADILYGEIILTDYKKNHLVTFTEEESLIEEVLLASTIRHQATFIKMDCFRKFGFYDATLTIVSDWKFFLVAFKNGAKFMKWNSIVAYCQIGGISSNRKLDFIERNIVLDELVSPAELKRCLVKRLRRNMDISRVSKRPKEKE